MGALDIQVGGDHYKGTPYQPVKLAVSLDLNFIQGNIVKYVSRYKMKNGVQDLRKVIHYAQLGQELNPRNSYTFSEAGEGTISLYCSANKLDELASKIVEAAVHQNWVAVVANTGRLIKKEYGTVY